MTLETCATYITPTQFQIKCDCSKGYHRFGNCKDQVSNRKECRSMFGHECEKHLNCVVNINESTIRTNNFPKIK